MKIYTLINQKGGVGKTTTAINLGAFLAKHNKRVLIVDMDPQANATSSLGYDKNDVKFGTYGVLIGTASIKDEIIRIDEFKLSLLPSSPSLAGAEIELIEFDDREKRLSQALTQVTDLYDYVLIDCPPSLNLLTVNALTTANSILVPIQCEFYAMEGLTQLMYTVQLVQKKLNPGLEMEGVVFTMYDVRTNLSQQVVESVREYLKERVYDTIIPRNVRLAEAPSHGLSIIDYDPKSSGAEAYRRLAEEVIGKEG